MKPSAFHRTALALATLLAAGGAWATTMTKAEFEAGKQRIENGYKADKAACGQSSGDARSLCLERASGKQKVARAQLAYDRSGKASDRHDLAVTTADADYAVGKEACNGQAGQAKDVCVAEAKATHTKALADATLARKVGSARRDSAADKRDAEYKLADEKCQSLAGDAKTACTDAAKAKFGKT